MMGTGDLTGMSCISVEEDEEKIYFRSRNRSVQTSE